MAVTWGHDEDMMIRFGDLALIFKVTAEQNRSNLYVSIGMTLSCAQVIL